MLVPAAVVLGVVSFGGGCDGDTGGGSGCGRGGAGGRCHSKLIRRDKPLLLHVLIYMIQQTGRCFVIGDYCPKSVNLKLQTVNP